MFLYVFFTSEVHLLHSNIIAERPASVAPIVILFLHVHFLYSKNIKFSKIYLLWTETFFESLLLSLLRTWRQSKFNDKSKSKYTTILKSVLGKYQIFFDMSSDTMTPYSRP